MIHADAVLVRDRPAEALDGQAGIVFHCPPARQQFIGVTRPTEQVCGVHARAVTIHVREMRERQHALVMFRGRVHDGFGNRNRRLAHLRPRQRGFQRVNRHAALPKRVPQIRRKETVLFPRVPDNRPNEQPAELSAQRGRLPPRALEQTRRTRHAKHQQAARIAVADHPQAAVRHSQPTLARQNQRRFRFKRIAQPQHRNGNFILDDFPHCVRSLLPGVEEDPEEGLRLGRPPHADLGLRHHPKPSLRPKRHLAHVRPRGRSRDGFHLQPPARRFHDSAREETLDLPIAVGLLSARTRDDPAAQRGILERLREMSKRIAARFQLFFKLRTRHARLERRQATGLIEVEQARHFFEGESQHGRVRFGRRDVADHTRPAAVGDDARARVARILQQAAHVFVAFGESHTVGKGVHASVA